jgi:hypothetical protein
MSELFKGIFFDNEPLNDISCGENFLTLGSDFDDDNDFDNDDKLLLLMLLESLLVYSASSSSSQISKIKLDVFF